MTDFLKRLSAWLLCSVGMVLLGTGNAIGVLLILPGVGLAMHNERKH